jgi:uncharacterized delta-60 repeat protein
MSPRETEFSKRVLGLVAVALFITTANAALTPDTTFGVDGRAGVSVGFRPNLDQDAQAVAIDAAGQIILGGTVQTLVSVFEYQAQPAVARLAFDGVPDQAFRINFIACREEIDRNAATLANVIAIQPDGKTILAGSCAHNKRLFVARLLPTGAFDTAFDGDGIVFIPAPSPLIPPCCVARAYAIALQPDGRLLVAGGFGNPDVAAAIWRLDSNGALDTTFADGGIHTLHIYSEYRALEIMSDGRIVAVGMVNHTSSNGVTNTNLLLTRLLPNGAIDTSFNGGVQNINVGILASGGDPDAPTEDVANGVALRADATVVVIAHSSDAGSLLMQFTSDGLLDDAFGEHGHVRLGDPSTTPLDLVLMDDGEAVVVGALPIMQVAVDGHDLVAYDLYAYGGAAKAASIVRQGHDKVVLALARNTNGPSYEMVAARFLVTPVGPPDSIPDPFDFTDIANAELDTLVVSGPVTITGLSVGTNVSVTGGEYAIGCVGPWLGEHSSGIVSNGETICVRHHSAGRSSAAVETTIFVGGVSATFRSVSGDADPDAFTFPSHNGVARSREIVSGPVTITGITIAAPISISGGEFSLGCDGVYSSAPATVQNGQTVCIRHISSKHRGGTTTSWLLVGSMAGEFSSTTRSGGAFDGRSVAVLLAFVVLRSRVRRLVPCVQKGRSSFIGSMAWRAGRPN